MRIDPALDANLPVITNMLQEIQVLTRDRPSDFIKGAQARNLVEAADFAYCHLGKPLNKFISVNWYLAGIDRSVQRALGILLKRVCDWFRHRHVPALYLYVIENPSSGGANVHILIHVPWEHCAAFNHQRYAWLKEAGAQRATREKVIKIDTDGERREYQVVGHYLRNLEDILKYLLKGTDGPTRTLLELEDNPHQGRIAGKRCGTSEAIGPSARARASTPSSPDAWERLWNPDRIILNPGKAYLPPTSPER
jgi:hypothetical protein